MRYIHCLLFICLSLGSCSAQESKDSVKVQASAKLTIQRFDKDFSQYLLDPSLQNQKNIELKYKDFLPAFGRVTINNSDSYKADFYARIQQYFSNAMLSSIYKEALNVFLDVSQYEAELSKADDIIAREFNGQHLPALYMHVSGFKENVMVLDEAISISADKYLGKDYAAYKQFFENYQLIQMQPQMITRDYLRAWLLSDKSLSQEAKKTLLSEMISEGKVLYVLSQLLPDWTTENMIAYTPDQLAWCEENEKKIWETVVQQSHLYSTDFLIIQKYMNESPYTTTLSSASPGRAGAWLGWQIVKAYVSKNNLLPLNKLVSLDSQQLLKDSSYNP